MTQYLNIWEALSGTLFALSTHSCDVLCYKPIPIIHRTLMLQIFPKSYYYILYFLCFKHTQLICVHFYNSVSKWHDRIVCIDLTFVKLIYILVQEIFYLNIYLWNHRKINRFSQMFSFLHSTTLHLIHCTRS